MVMSSFEMLMMLIWLYRIHQVQSVEPYSHTCVCSKNILDMCHYAGRRCASGHGFPEVITMDEDFPPGFNKSDFNYISNDESVYSTTISMHFDYQCKLEDSECRGKFQVNSPFKISINGLTYTHLCDDVLREPSGGNSYGEGVYLSTFIRRLILHHYKSLPDISLGDPVHRWISCPNIRSDLNAIMSFMSFKSSHLVLYSCWCFANYYDECHKFLSLRGPYFAACYRDPGFNCYLKLCSDDKGKFIDFLDEVEGFPPFGSAVQTY